MINICFVCTGNTCRSIMAERLLKKTLKQKGVKNVKVTSRGIFAKKENISPNAQITLKKLKASASDRKSIKLGKTDKDTLYVVMTEDIRRYVKADNVVTVKQLIGFDILDPYGQSEDVYLQVAKDLEKANDVILEEIIKWRGL